jgi:transposase-like protein
MEPLQERPRRRHWSSADKRAAVELAFAGDGDASAVAASLGIESNASILGGVSSKRLPTR